FSAISLIVSSIMIAIVIYTSVLERTKEIGVLRSIGARKKDVARVFISESMMIGFASGVIGVLFTFIIQYPVSAILYNILNIKSLMSMVWWHALVMITLSVTLSLLAGVVPSQMAANKDPVIALRSE
ncbi:MAG: ABC transporter permease, partial [Christensenellales bacterium]